MFNMKSENMYSRVRVHCCRWVYGSTPSLQHPHASSSPFSSVQSANLLYIIYGCWGAPKVLIKAKRHSQLLYSHLFLSPSFHTSITLPPLYPLPKSTLWLSLTTSPTPLNVSFHPSLHCCLPPYLLTPVTQFPSITCQLHTPSSLPPCLLSTPVSPLFHSLWCLPAFSLPNNPLSSKRVRLPFRAACSAVLQSKRVVRFVLILMPT